MKTQTTPKPNATISPRAEALKIIPYARNASHAFQTRGLLRDWDNGWDNCWHNGDWNNSPHPWQNGSAIPKPNEAIWNNFMAATSSDGTPNKLKDAIVVRDDGFIHNKLNEVVFYADKYALEVVKSLLEKPAHEVAQTHKGVLELLWLN